jgi:hypothetical protein
MNMSVLDQIRKLEEQKASLLSAAKSEAMKKAEAAIAELNELGFNYRLVQDGETTRTPRATGTRRSGVRDEVLTMVKNSPNGISRAQLLEAMDAKGDKSAEQSISNALAALKKAGTVSGEGGVYKVA